jgi:hypothetical protein
MHRRLFLFALLILAFMVACGPSEVEIAAMTAAAATDTPVPTPTPTLTPTPTNTPTPTPVPYDLVVSVTDAEGSPIAAAIVALPESGDDQPVQTDDAGQVSWANLPGESITLNVSAQGYFPAEESATIERGPNEVIVALERDPFGLLPSEACSPNETVLYVEDFQDGMAQGWDNVTAALEYNAPNGWDVIDDPEEAGNTVLIATNEARDFGAGYYETMFDNAVWRLRVKIQSEARDMFGFLNWRHGQTEGGEYRYVVQFGTQGSVFTDLSRLEFPEPGHFSVGTTSHSFRQDQWYFVEISTYEGVTQLWIDGVQLKSYEDPTPLGEGGIGLEVHAFSDAPFTYSYDNFAVCGLDAPFETLPPPEETEAE